MFSLFLDLHPLLPTLHQVARNWSELLGFGAKMAPTMKQRTWSTSNTAPRIASFLVDMFSMIAPAILTPPSSHSEKPWW